MYNTPIIVTKDTPEQSDSFLAQGGIATLLDEEDYQAYYEDTMKAGHYQNNPEAVDIPGFLEYKVVG